MSTNKAKDGAPEGQTNKSKYAGEEDDVEGHRQPLGKDAGPEGQTNKSKFDGGEDDDVEGHKR